LIKEEKKLSVADLSFISARTISRIFDPSKGSFHYITKVLSYRREGCTVVLDCCTDKNEKIAIWIDLCGPNIFRLRMDASGERE